MYTCLSDFWEITNKSYIIRYKVYLTTYSFTLNTAIEVCVSSSSEYQDAASNSMRFVQLML